MNLSTDPNNVKWTIIPSSDEFGSYTISDYDGYRDPTLEELFYIDQSGLLILNATTAPNGEGPISTSGLYIAQCSNDGNRTGAKLLVVRECFKIHDLLPDLGSRDTGNLYFMFHVVLFQLIIIMNTT